MTNLILKRQLAKNKKKGFTLIELIVVIVIIAIIAAIAVPALTRYINQANVRAAQAQAHNIQVILQAEVTEFFTATINPDLDGSDGATAAAGFFTTNRPASPYPNIIRAVLAERGVNLSSDSVLTNIGFSEGRALEKFRYDHNGTIVYYCKGKYEVYPPGVTIPDPPITGW